MRGGRLPRSGVSGAHCCCRPHTARAACFSVASGGEWDACRGSREFLYCRKPCRWVPVLTARIRRCADNYRRRPLRCDACCTAAAIIPRCAGQPQQETPTVHRALHGSSSCWEFSCAPRTGPPHSSLSAHEEDPALNICMCFADVFSPFGCQADGGMQVSFPDGQPACVFELCLGMAEDRWPEACRVAGRGREKRGEAG